MIRQTFIDIMLEIERTQPNVRFLSPMNNNLLPVDDDDAAPAAGFTHHKTLMATPEAFKALVTTYQKTPILVAKDCVLYNSSGAPTKEPGWFLYWRLETASLYGVYCYAMQ